MKNKIIAIKEVDPKELKANPNNWRLHPETQKKPLKAILNDVGWVQNIIVNKNTGNIVDGHARVEIAIDQKEATVPVVYVDLTEKEEKLILATLDPLSAIAQTDQSELKELLDMVQSDNEDVIDFIDFLFKENGLLVDEIKEKNTGSVIDNDKNILIVELISETETKKLYEELTNRGFDVRIME